MNDRQALVDGLAALGLRAEPAMVAGLLAYADELEKWNRVYNLTSIPAGEQTITHHLLDSLAVADAITGEAIADIGSGAGFPGMPLALYHPGRRFTLVDSAGKKTRFMAHVRILLGLDNVEVVQGRAEAMTGRYDEILCRGLGSLADIARMTAHLLAPAGRILALKGAISESEAKAVAAPFVIERIQPLAVPGIDAPRSLVVVTRSA